MQNAQFENCSAAELESTVGLFGCAVVLKPKAKSLPIQYLSANTTDSAAQKRGRPMFKQP